MRQALSSVSRPKVSFIEKLLTTPWVWTRHLSATATVDSRMVRSLTTQYTSTVSYPVLSFGFGVFQLQRRAYSGPPKSTVRTVYRNRNGEKIMFEPCSPPLGYTFVEAGNHYLTRRCRKLAQTVYAVYNVRYYPSHSKQLGIYVPNDVFEQANSDFQTQGEKTNKKIERVLGKMFPRIPSTDRQILQTFISEFSPTVTGDALLKNLGFKVYAFVRSRYTRYRSLKLFLVRRKAHKAQDQVHRETMDILRSWGWEKDG
ncbi:hypothetical protein OPT61_g3966 [Boeremia exigua]|uniref:Uncharacterized protein n=1 Tax=Boeremia exigua TaxID=749465 RepID=A0ACC2IFW1_9PLEO|nr:hypothetical protein OPT61_g3966 [Boeremia exigua]